VLDVFEPLLHRVSRTGEPAQGLANLEEIVAGHRGARLGLKSLPVPDSGAGHEYLILKEKLVWL
jgi:hypothetical protein